MRVFLASLNATLGGLLAASGAFAQAPEDHSHFEVVSIKPVVGRVPHGYAGPGTGDFGHLIIGRTTLREVIAGAYPEYGVFGERISGPLWIENEYSLEATLPPGSTNKDIPQMTRNLLAERFGLKFHSEDKEVQGFELIVGDKGFKLTPSTAKVDPTPQPLKRDRDGNPVITGQGTYFSSRDYDSGTELTSFNQCATKQLAAMLSGDYGQNSIPVTDKTEIQGLFDFRLLLPIPSYNGPAGIGEQLPFSARMRPPDSPDASVADLRGLSGSLERQTGLRLKPVKLMRRAMVIDNIARTPTEN